MALTTTVQRLAASLLAGLAVSPLAAQELPALPPLAADRAEVSVIGVSSGGYMATQLAVAWPSRIDGLGVLAAGPWGCARGELGLALGQCMTTRRGLPDRSALDARYREYRDRDLVGSPEALASLRAYVWHGGEDATVTPTLGRLLTEQLADWLADPERQLHWELDEDAGHGWPVDTSPHTPSAVLADCRRGGETHLLACDRDIAGEALRWLHGNLTAPKPGETPTGRLMRFDQSPFDAKGLAESGYLFVPRGCDAGGCSITVALHGCAMSEEALGDTFVRHNGLNAWAGANDRLVLYPQAESSLANPRGCWDWWGYAESTWQLDPLHDSRRGSQLGALKAMIDRLQQVPES